MYIIPFTKEYYLMLISDLKFLTQNLNESDEWLEHLSSILEPEPYLQCSFNDNNTMVLSSCQILR